MTRLKISKQNLFTKRVTPLRFIDHEHSRF
jgi:hypothetical protein